MLGSRRALMPREDRFFSLLNSTRPPLAPLRWPGVISLFAKAHVFDRALQVQDFLGQRPHGVLDRLARANRCTVSTTATLSPRRSLSSREVVSYFDDAVLTTMWPASM